MEHIKYCNCVNNVFVFFPFFSRHLLPCLELHSLPRKERENGIYWKDQRDDMDEVTIPTPCLRQFLHNSDSRWADHKLRIDWDNRVDGSVFVEFTFFPSFVSLLFRSNNEKWINSFSQRIRPFWVRHKPGA